MDGSKMRQQVHVMDVPDFLLAGGVIVDVDCRFVKNRKIHPHRRSYVDDRVRVTDDVHQQRPVFLRRHELRPCTLLYALPPWIRDGDLRMPAEDAVKPVCRVDR